MFQVILKDQYLDVLFCITLWGTHGFLPKENYIHIYLYTSVAEQEYIETMWYPKVQYVHGVWAI